MRIIRFSPSALSGVSLERWDCQSLWIGAELVLEAWQIEYLFIGLLSRLLPQLL